MVTRGVGNVNTNGVIAGRVRRESVVGAVPALISSRRDRACIQAMRRYYHRLGRLWRSRPLTNVAEVHSESTGQLHAEIPKPARYGCGAIERITG